MMNLHFYTIKTAHCDHELHILAEEWEPVMGGTAVTFYRQGENVGTFFGPLHYILREIGDAAGYVGIGSDIPGADPVVPEQVDDPPSREVLSDPDGHDLLPGT